MRRRHLLISCLFLILLEQCHAAYSVGMGTPQEVFIGEPLVNLPKSLLRKNATAASATKTIPTSVTTQITPTMKEVYLLNRVQRTPLPQPPSPYDPTTNTSTTAQGWWEYLFGGGTTTLTAASDGNCKCTKVITMTQLVLMATNTAKAEATSDLYNKDNPGE